MRWSAIPRATVRFGPGEPTWTGGRLTAAVARGFASAFQRGNTFSQFAKTSLHLSETTYDAAALAPHGLVITSYEEGTPLLGHYEPFNAKLPHSVLDRLRRDPGFCGQFANRRQPLPRLVSLLHLNLSP